MEERRFAGGMRDLNTARNATASESERLVMLPGDIVSERPVVERFTSVGIPHNGPCTRGKRTKSTSMSGTDCASMAPAVRS